MPRHKAMGGLLALLLLRSTGLATPVTLEAKDLLVPLALQQIAKQAGVECSYPRAYGNLKVSVFAKDVPAKDLFDRIASTLGFEGSVKESKYDFAPGPEYLARTKNEYVDAESRLVWKPVQARLEALAALTQHPFGSPVAASAGKDSPEGWADSKIGQPAYYALGLAYRIGVLNPSAPSYVRSDFKNLFSGVHTAPFLVEAPTAEGRLYGETWIDDNARAIKGQLIAIGGVEATGELRLVGLMGAKAEQEPLLDRPFAFAHPPAALAKTAFAKLIAAWETPLTAIPKEMTERPATIGLELPTSEYFDGRISLSEKVERIYRETGLPIVATSFRTPALSKVPPHMAVAGDYIKDLADSESCTMRAENGFLLVRHPAYWFFQRTEPPEPLVAKLETISKTRMLELGEYAELARAIGQNPETRAGQEIPIATSRLLNLRGMLLRFDGSPLATAYPALYLFGSMAAGAKQALLAGEKWDCVSVSSFGNSGYGRAEVVADEVARYGPIFGASMSERYFTPASRGVSQEILEKNWPDPSMSARYFWVESQGDRSYQLNVGFPYTTVASYPVIIHPNP